MKPIQTIYGEINANLYDKLNKIKLLVCDVDGVFSDGRIYLGNDGEELKAFHTRDGYGVKAVVEQGVQVAVITGRTSNIVLNRMKALNVQHIIQGEENKAQALEALASQLGLAQAQIASIGDDVPDMGMFEQSSVRIAVADAHPQVKNKANWITKYKGGFGAVREVCDLLLQSHGQLDHIHGASV